MLSATPLPWRSPSSATAASLEASFPLEVDRTQELLTLCAQEGHPLILSGAWVLHQCGVGTLKGPITSCEWGQGQLALQLGGATLFWHESQVSRTEWRRWREPLGLRHGLRLWDEQHAVALNLCAPLRSPHCEGALWRAWMDWIADIPVCSPHGHTT